MEIENKKEVKNILGDLPKMLNGTANVINILINGLNANQKTMLKKHLDENGYNEKIQQAMQKLEDISKIKI